MFGFSFGEILVISLVTLVAVGPQKLPGMLKTMGQWARKLRKMTMDVRQQTGIDEMLRAEGIQLSELRSLMRGYHGGFPGPAPSPAPAAAPAPVASTTRYEDPYQNLEPDPTREYPLEGADAYGALPDDLLEPASSGEVAAAPGAAPAKPESLPEIEPEPEPVKAQPVEAPLAPASSEPAAAEPAPAPPRPASALSEAPAAKPPSPPVRSVPPPPPRRSGPPRPAPAAPVVKPEATPPSSPTSTGSANGNG